MCLTEQQEKTITELAESVKCPDHNASWKFPFQAYECGCHMRYWKFYTLMKENGFDAQEPPIHYERPQFGKYGK